MHLVAISALLGVVAGVQLSRSAAPGPEFMDVKGYMCGLGRDQVAIYYPDASDKTYPLISMANGAHTELPSNNSEGTYVKLLTKLARKGYVVVVPLSAENGWCSQQTTDQLVAIEAMQSNPRVDWSKGVGLLGHSMGGGATCMSSADEAAVKKYNIRAAVALHPVIAAWDHPEDIQPQVPILFGAGTADDMAFPEAGMDEVMWKANRRLYEQTAAEGKLYALITGAPHYEPYTDTPWSKRSKGFVRGKNRWTDLVAQFFDCHIKDDSQGSACEQIYQNRSSILGVPMTEYQFVPPTTSKKSKELEKEKESKASPTAKADEAIAELGRTFDELDEFDQFNPAVIAKADEVFADMDAY